MTGSEHYDPKKDPKTIEGLKELLKDTKMQYKAYYEAMDTLQSNWFQYIHNNTVLPTAAEMYAGFLDMKEGGESDVVSAVKEGANELPHIWKASRPASNWWHIPGGSCMQRVAVLKEELMASAWHPKRMVEWCWDEDEKRESNELQMTFVTRIQPYRLWQDEVLVTDASDRGHIEGLASIRLFTGQRVKFVAMTGRGFVTVSGKDGRFIHFDA
eukprot:jgi/Astpho2/5753/fgenesh1_pg.00080_%23_22_t